MRIIYTCSSIKCRQGAIFCSFSASNREVFEDKQCENFQRKIKIIVVYDGKKTMCLNTSDFECVHWRVVIFSFSSLIIQNAIISSEFF